jgi:hypothetical protein
MPMPPPGPDKVDRNPIFSSFAACTDVTSAPAASAPMMVFTMAVSSLIDSTIG